jgi:cation:H+ antiporter
LATVAYAVVGVVFLLNRKTHISILLSKRAASRLSRDQAWFMGIFVFKVALGLIVFTWKPWLGMLFLLAYAIYIWHEMRREDDGPTEEKLEPLKFRPQDTHPSTIWILLQTLIALIVIFAGSQLFVRQLTIVGPWLGMQPQTVALLFSPIATELPEILNAVIWVRQGKQSLAFGNISGAMMIQATIPSALGIIFTPWLLDRTLVWAAATTMISIFGLYLLLRRSALTPARLALFGMLYGLFAGSLFVI